MPASPAVASPSAAALPPADDWRTSDQDEINRRRLRAREESPRIVNRDERFPVFSNFDVHSPSGVTYAVEIEDLVTRQFSCECVDFRVNGLGTCKHVEAVLDHLERDRPMDYAAARAGGSPRIDLVPDRPAQTLQRGTRAGAAAADSAPALRPRWPARRRLPARDGARTLEGRAAARIARLPGSRHVAGMPPPRGRGARPAPNLRAQRPRRRLAGAGNAPATVPLPAGGDAAPRLRRARAAGRRDGSRQDDPGRRRVRVAAPARARASGCWSSRPLRCKASGRNRSVASRACRCRRWRAAASSGSRPTSVAPRRFSPWSITMRCSPTRWRSTSGSGRRSSSSTRRSASRIGTRRPRWPSNACAAAMPGC